MKASYFCVLIASCIAPLTITNGVSAQENPKERVAISETATIQDEPKAEPKKEDQKEDWVNLMDSKYRKFWKPTVFGGEGKVEFKDEQFLIEAGYPLSGITYSGDFPKENFEIVVEANRLTGSDFLMGLTFPIGESYCSYIAGGWGGGVVGISSIDGMDASENATTTYNDFKNEKWYTFKVRVDSKNITGWIDGEEVFKQEREGHRFSTRVEVELSQPFGMSTFESKVAIRKMQYRKLDSDQPKPADKPEK